MLGHVALHPDLTGEALPTHVADVRFLRGVLAKFVLSQVACLRESLAANFALIWFPVLMDRLKTKYKIAKC
jgi:hypothetical protein